MGEETAPTWFYWLLFWWLPFTLFTGGLAARYGRSIIVWAAVGFALGLFGFITLLLVGRRRQRKQEERP